MPIGVESEDVSEKVIFGGTVTYDEASMDEVVADLRLSRSSGMKISPLHESDAVIFRVSHFKPRVFRIQINYLAGFHTAGLQVTVKA